MLCTRTGSKDPPFLIRAYRHRLYFEIRHAPAVRFAAADACTQVAAAAEPAAMPSSAVPVACAVHAPEARGVIRKRGCAADILA